MEVGEKNGIFLVYRKRNQDGDSNGTYESYLPLFSKDIRDTAMDYFQLVWLEDVGKILRSCTFAHWGNGQWEGKVTNVSLSKDVVPACIKSTADHLLSSPLI